MLVRSGIILVVALFAAATAPLSMGAPVSSVKQVLRLDMGRQLQNSISPKFPLQETIRVPIWIPGFDDDDPPFGFAPACSNPSDTKRTALEFPIEGRLTHSARTVGMDICGGMRRKLPRTRAPAGEGRVNREVPIL